MTLEILKQLLSSFGWEYKLTYNNKVIYSDRYNELTKNMIYEDTFQYESSYYRIKKKNIVIDGMECKVSYLEDVTKYIKFIFGLKKDKITGLATREDLEDYIAKLNKISIFVLCDIDNFKNINDNYGHIVGDEILNLLGNVIKSNIRRNDFAGRYGGDEFLIIFDTNNIKCIKERIEMINNEFKLQTKEMKLTFSAGISIFDNNYYKTIKEADMALYYAKQNGKNNAVIYNKKMEKIFENEKKES